MGNATQAGDPHPDLLAFKYPLPHLFRSLKLKRKIKVVAIGSSSTAGEGDIVPYPARLELLLRGKFHDRMIDVVNRGIGGQEAPSEVSRFQPDVIDEAPSVVIWQVGTNAVFWNAQYNFDDVAGSIATGLDWLAPLPLDVVMMDLQYTPAMVGTDEKKALSEDIVARISAVAEKAKVNVFRRFALMEHWVRAGIPIEDLVRKEDPNHLHMSEWATGHVTQALFETILSAPPPPPPSTAATAPTA